MAVTAEDCVVFNFCCCFITVDKCAYLEKARSAGGTGLIEARTVDKTSDLGYSINLVSSLPIFRSPSFQYPRWLPHPAAHRFCLLIL